MLDINLIIITICMTVKIFPSITVDFFLFLQSIAEDNAERRNSYTDTHTIGPKSLAQVRADLLCDFVHACYMIFK